MATNHPSSKSRRRPKGEFTPAHAALIVESHELDALFSDKEEETLLREQNPELYEAQKALVMYARKNK